ncbi:MAG TPA: ribonuclease HII [Motilibacterales bacterium]|nr:ribonuclease HII [Motilibacterales bacterium]
MTQAPTLRVERALLRSGATTLACVDEVGRGALAGPVSVGVVVLDLGVGSAPKGLRDSKLLTPRARRELLPRLRRWPVAFAVGHADPYEVDAVGIICALRVAAARAFGALGMTPDRALLDGNHNWLSTPQEPEALFPDPRRAVGDSLADMTVVPGDVQTRVRADLTCAGVAAASVLAKCERDEIMVDLARQHPQYGWALNKGYSAPDHVDALRRLGPTPLHRVSWNLPRAEACESVGDLSTTLG